MVDAAAAGAARAAAVPAAGRRRRRARPRRRAGVRRQRLRRPGGHRRRAGQPRADGRLRAAVGGDPVRVAACSATSSACSARGARSGAWSAAVVARVAPAEPLDYPERLGRWPAMAGIFFFGIVELCWAAGREPQTLAILGLLYLVTMFVGMSLYGVEPWTRKADPFGVYFGIFASLAPVTRRDGVLYARPPVVGAIKLAPLPGTVALVITSIGITAFDGGSEGTVFNSIAPAPAGLLPLARLRHRSRARAHVPAGAERDRAAGDGHLLGRDLGDGPAGPAAPDDAHRARPLARPHARADRRRLRRRPLLLAAGLQRAGHRAAGLRPARRRQRPVRGSGPPIDYSVVSATAIWYAQVGSLVIGHVCALVLGHDRALALYEDPKAGTRSQIVMLILMVCFTCLGLYLLSASNQ